MSDFLRRVNGWLWKAKPTEVTGSQHGTGALIDTRPAELKLEDVHFAEVVGAPAPVKWVEKDPSTWRKFPIFNQDGSSGCVAFTMAKILGVLRWLKDGVFVMFSPGDIYIRRSNKNVQGAGSLGMIGTDAFAIAAQGVTLDALVSSQNLGEDEINALKVPGYALEIGQIFRLGGSTPVFLPNGDIDAVASVIQVTGKPVMVWFYFTYAEWGDVPAMADPSMEILDGRSLRHSVTAVDFTLYKGKKALIIEDSWGKFGIFDGQRVINEDWHKARNWFAAYPMNFARVSPTIAPSLAGFELFTKPLVFIPWDTTKNQPADMVAHEAQKADVIRLQKILQILTDIRGVPYFPTNAQCTGYFGATTAGSTYHWQSENRVAPQDVLDGLQGRRFGPGSIADMNAIIKASA